MSSRESDNSAGRFSPSPMICERSITELLPYFACGRVIHGFGRGGKQLGCPTANLDEHAVERLPSEFPCGVYYGWANIDNGPVHQMVMSIGWNPHFKNRKKTMEAHILYQFPTDFYGSLIKLVISGFIRDMKSFQNLDELITAINEDIRISKEKLATVDMIKLKGHSYFTTNGEKARI